MSRLRKNGKQLIELEQRKDIKEYGDGKNDSN